jgi:hypothetical protein
MFKYKKPQIYLVIMKKGITPLLAAVLILAIAVIVANMLLSWMSSITKDQTGTISNKSSSIVGCGDIIIDTVFLDLNDNVSRVVVRSMGAASQITSANVYTSGGVPVGNITKLPVTLANGQTTTIEFNIAGNISSCSGFGEAIVATTCASDRYTRPPKGC